MTTLPLLKEVVSPAVVRALGYALLHSLWQGTVLALVLAGLLPLLRQRRAELRYAVAAAALAGLVLAAAGTFGYYYQAAAPATVAAAPLTHVAPAAYVLLPAAAPAPAQAGPLTWLRAASHRSEPYLPLLVGAWLLGALLMGGRLAGGLLYTGRLRRAGTHRLGLDWQQRLATLAQRAGLRRPVALLESARVAGPLVLGYLRPVILLPLGAVAGLSPALLEALLAHEVAHIARRDYLLNLGLAVAEVVFFYHPAVWFMANCLRTERENCCDDQAAALCGGDNLRVARALAALAELEAAAPAPHLALAAAGTGGRGSLLARVRRLALGGASAPTLAEGIMAGLLTVLGLLGLGTGVVLAAAPGRPPHAGQAPAASATSAVPADTVRRRPGTRKASVPVPPTPPLPPLPPNTTISGSGYTVAENGDTVQRFDMHLETSEDKPRRRAQASELPRTVVVEKDKKGRLTKLTVNGQEVDVPGQKTKRKSKKADSTVDIVTLPPAYSYRPESLFDGSPQSFRFETPGTAQRYFRLEAPRGPQRLYRLSPQSGQLRHLDRSPNELSEQDRQSISDALRNTHLDASQLHELQQQLQLSREALRQLQRSPQLLRLQKDFDKQLRLEQNRNGVFRLHLDQPTDANARQAEADARQAEADARQADADARQADVNSRQAEADSRQAEADSRVAEADSRVADADSRAAGRDNRRTAAALVARRAELRARIAAEQAELRALGGSTRTPGYSIYGKPGHLKLRVQPVPPAPPAPPAQGRPGPPPPPPPAPPISTDKLRDALRQDNLIGKADRNFSFELNDQGGKVNGKALTTDQLTRYRQLLHQPVGSKGKSSSFNMTISED